jgi:hypothetical protein
VRAPTPAPQGRTRPHGSPKVTRYGQPYPSRLAGGTLQLTLRLANPGEQYTAVEVRA